MKQFVLRTVLIIVAFTSIHHLAFAQCAEKSCSECPSEKKAAVHGQSKSSNSATSAAAAAASDDEFLPFDEAKELTQDSVPMAQPNAETTTEGSITDRFLFVPIVGLLASILAGIAVRFRPTRHMKVVFLLSSIAFFGFYSGACPCPISSFSHTIIFAFSGEGNWQAMVWFIGLIPITFFLGQTWCGWVCHLGAMQEFLYKRNRFKALKSVAAQRIMKYLRIALFAVLLVQLLITNTYLFDRIDPFRIVYNLGLGADWATWTLTGFVLLVSLFIYRPFCRAACPIGLMLGLVKFVPFASRISSNSSCLSCSTASKACDYQAINKIDGSTKISHPDCIACGDCLSACSKQEMKFKNLRSAQSVICTK